MFVFLRSGVIHYSTAGSELVEAVFDCIRAQLINVFRCTTTYVTLPLLHCLDVKQKAAESDLLNCLTYSFALGIRITY